MHCIGLFEPKSFAYLGLGPKLCPYSIYKSIAYFGQALRILLEIIKDGNFALSRLA